MDERQIDSCDIFDGCTSSFREHDQMPSAYCVVLPRMLPLGTSADLWKIERPVAVVWMGYRDLSGAP